MILETGIDCNIDKVESTQTLQVLGSARYVGSRTKTQIQIWNLYKIHFLMKKSKEKSRMKWKEPVGNEEAGELKY